MSRPIVTDDPVFLRSVLDTCGRVLDCLNAERKAATTVPELLAIAEATDWMQSHERAVRKRLDKAEAQAYGNARQAVAS